MKKILFLLRDVYECGGIQQSTCLIGNELVKLGYDVTFLSLYHRDETPFFDINDNVHDRALLDGFADTKKDFIRIKSSLKRYLKANHYDVIIVQGTAFCVYFSNETWEKTRVIVCEHAYYGQGKVGGLHWLGQKCALRKADTIVTLTHLDEANYRGHSLRRECKYITIPNSYKPDKIYSCYSVTSKTIVSCGTLTALKRFEMCIEAGRKVFEKHPDWTWEIYGDGVERNKLLDLIYKYKLHDNIRLMGYEKDKNLIYGDKAFFVMTSSFEGFGMVLVEAMQYHLPLVAFDVKYGPKEIVEKDVGILCPDGDLVALTDTIISLIENAEKRVWLSKNSERALQLYNIDNIINKWDTLLQRDEE